MKRNFMEAMINRRSHYSITDKSPLSDKEIEDLIKSVVTHVPSAFNSQTTRTVLLLGEQHRKLWQIVKHTLRNMIPEDSFKQTEKKIDGSFASGYGTILFFEDHAIVEELQRSFPIYKDNFPGWALQTSAMHQYATWVALTDTGFGASLQHYNPLIDEEVRRTWNLPQSWQLIAQMPFGTSIDEPTEKVFSDIEPRVLVFK